MSLAEELNEKLDIASKVYDIHIGSFTVSIPQSVFVTWGVMLFLVILAIIFTRKLEVVPKGKQAVFESFMDMIHKLFYDILGENGKEYIPYLTTVLLYLGIANMLGLIGIAPPTKDMNVTAGLALMSIVLVQIAGIRKRGVGGWLKHFAHPIAMITPMNILELGIRPLSLCMRLFGNVLGAFIIMELIIYCVPAVIPLAASAYFDIFDGVIQAYVFCFLTTLFIQESIED